MKPVEMGSGVAMMARRVCLRSLSNSRVFNSVYVYVFAVHKLWTCVFLA